MALELFAIFCAYFHRHKAFAVSRNIGELGVEKKTSILPGDSSSNIVEEPFNPTEGASRESFTMVIYSLFLI